MRIQTDADLKPGGLTPEASHMWDENHGFGHICVRCRKNKYSYGNNGLCYICVQEENTDQKLSKELRSEVVSISMGLGELSFLISELKFITRSHEGAYYYKARCDYIRNTLQEQERQHELKPKLKTYQQLNKELKKIIPKSKQQQRVAKTRKWLVIVEK